jgi:hypothetical protein
LAIRYSFLQSLHLLGQKKWLVLNENATNSSYAFQLSNTPLHSGFKKILWHYNYIWYGEVPLNETLFTELKNNFEQFNANIKPKINA